MVGNGKQTRLKATLQHLRRWWSHMLWRLLQSWAAAAGKVLSPRATCSVWHTVNDDDGDITEVSSCGQLSPSVRPNNLATRLRPPSATVVSTEPFLYGTQTLRCLQKETATYRHWSVSLRRDSDNVTHCWILSSDKAEWWRILATLCRWRCCFVADQLWFRLDLFCILLALVFNSVMYCTTSTIVVAFETNISLSRDMHTRERRSDDDRPDMVNKVRVVGFSNLWVGESLCDGIVTASGSQWSVCHSWRTWSTTNDAWWLKWFCCHRTGRFTILRRQAASQFSTNNPTICHTTLAFNDWYRSVSRGNSDHTKLIMAHQ